MLVAKYNNDLNLLTFPRLSLTQKKMVQLILAFTRDEKEAKGHQNFLARFFNKDTRTIEIGFAKFYKLVNGEEWKVSATEVGSMIDDMLEKLLHTILSYEDEHKVLKFVCFEKAEYVKHEQIVRITIQQDFYKMITNFKNGFTIIDYFEYCTLNSIYSQNLYPILRQFRNTGKVTIFRDKWAQFYSIMQFPENAAMRDIDKVLKQVVTELSSEKTLFDQQRIPFKNLKYEKVKDKSGRGRGGKVTGIEFSFTPESKELENPQELESKQKDQIIEQQRQELDFNRNENFALKESMRRMGIGNPYAEYQDKSYTNSNSEVLKIVGITENFNQGISVRWKNMENDKIFTKTYQTANHFKKYLSNLRENY